MVRDFEAFMDDLEEDPEYRSNFKLYKSKLLVFEQSRFPFGSIEVPMSLCLVQIQSMIQPRPQWPAIWMTHCMWAWTR